MLHHRRWLVRMHPVAGVGDGVDLHLGIQRVDGFEVLRLHVLETRKKEKGVRFVFWRENKPDTFFHAFFHARSGEIRRLFRHYFASLGRNERSTRYFFGLSFSMNTVIFLSFR